MSCITDCFACGACAGACLQGAISLSDTAKIDDKKCTKCKLCERICPVGAIKI